MGWVLNNIKKFSFTLLGIIMVWCSHKNITSSVMRTKIFTIETTWCLGYSLKYSRNTRKEGV